MIQNITQKISYSTKAAMLLVMMLTTMTVWAQTTSTINVGGTDYALYTGFTATAGTESYANFVDGNTSTKWEVMKKNGKNANDFAGGTEDPALVEFHADAPVIPKGYVLTYDNSVNENWKPTSWALKAKLNENDDWTEIHSSNSPLGNGSRFEIACNNNGDNQYQYFRFEIYDVGSTMQSILNELQIYAQFTYTPVHARAATCTEYGLTNDGYLRSDGKYFSDENGTNELTVGNGLIDKILHTGVVHHEASDSNIEYWQCSMCGKYFTDEACTHEVTADEVFKGIFGTLTAGTNGESGYYTLESKTYTLTEDVNTAGYIYVPEGVTATIDLNGHTIDRGLTSAVQNGYVIYVKGALTLTDSSTGGTVKGGMDNSSDHVSCVKVISDNGGAAFTLEGGTLIGNRSSEYNKAVLGGNNTSITISGGKITGDAYGIFSYGNITVSGGEISGNTIGIQSINYSISVSDNPVITGNTKENVKLDDVLTIVGELTDGANIGITKGSIKTPTDNAPVTFTSDYGTYNNNVSPSTYFSLDNDGKIQTSPHDYMTVVMGWNEDKTEIAVGTAVRTVTFDMKGHGSDIEAVSLLSGYKVTEPTEPTAEGWSFGGWYTNADCTDGNEWNFNNGVTSDVTLHALWSQGQTYRVTLSENMVLFSADQTAVGGKYPSGTNIRFKVKSADYTVVGDVSDGTNTLTPDGDGIYTVTVGDADITITATVKKAVEPNKTLSGSESYTANDGDVLTGSTSGTVTIAADAKITLSGVTITGGIVCAGTAEITLVGTNSVTGFSRFDPNINAYRYTAGIQIGGSGTTLTINGDGSLTANGAQYAAGIGLNGAWNVTEDVIGGNIVINGGNITANGGVGAAGIGAGFTKDKNNSSSRKAIVGNITIKGGTVTAVGVTAVGGHGADGIGAGDNIYNATYQIGTVTIYDDIDKVDASAITESVTYMHVENETETDVTANKSDYFIITEDGNRRVIAPKDNTDYTITIANGIEHGTLTGAATAKYMENVTITATPALGYRFSRLVVKDAQNNDVASTDNSFFMPKSNVTVSAVFEQGTHGTTEFKWIYRTGPAPEDEVLETIYDGVTTVNIQNSGKSYQIRKYEGNTYYKFLLDNDTHEANIPYAGGTGEFYEFDNPTNFNVPYDGETGYYDITMTEADNGKWSVSILKTAGQMDVVPDQTYTGSAITPEPTVIAGSLSLTKGTDYEYSYTNNTNVGTAKVRATFKGDYASLGYVEKEFTIAPKAPKAVTNNDITVAIPSQTYTGSEIEPAVAVKDGETTLTLGTDYEVAYSNNVNAGTATVTITGKGNYYGETTATFTIARKAVTVTADNKTKVEGESDPKLTAAVTGLIGSDQVTYTLSRASGEAVGEYTITPTGEATQGNYTVSYATGKLTITAKPEEPKPEEPKPEEPKPEESKPEQPNPEEPKPEQPATDQPSTEEPKNTDTVNKENSVTVGGETFYEPSKETAEAIKNHVNTDIALPANENISVTAEGYLNFAQGPDIDFALRGLKAHEVVKLVFEGRMFVDSSKLRQKGAGSRGFTRGIGDMELVSGVEYEVLADGDLILTAKLSSGATTVKEIGKASSATAISGISAEGDDDADWYDLQGRRLTAKPTQRGLYIHHGRKVLVK